MRSHLGSDICARLDDEAVIEIMLNGDGELWEDRLGVGMSPIGRMDAPAAHSLISLVASTLRVSVTTDNPILECELPIRGARFEAIISPNTPEPIIAIRLKAVRIFSLDDYVADGIMTPRQQALIRDALSMRRSMIVSGGTTTGKTTLANAILAEVAAMFPLRRLVIIEDTTELQCASKNVVRLRTSPTVDQTRLLKATMRLRPDSIIVGEVRDGAAYTLIKAWNTGHDLGLCTVHANDAKSALTRIEQLAAEAMANPIRAQIAEAINLIIPIVRVGNTGRRVDPIVQVEGLHDGDYVVSTLE